MSAYTPGPWSFVQGGTGDFPIWNVRIGTRGLITLPATAGMETMDADARLIAAAPDLLEAVKLAVTALRALGADEVDGALLQCCAAIYNATGGTP